jgi:hypothetical protein
MMTIDVTVEFPNNEATVITKVVCNLKGFSLKKGSLYNMAGASACKVVCYLDVSSLDVQLCVSAVISY